MSQSSPRMNLKSQSSSGRNVAEPEANMAERAYETAENCVQNYPSTSVAITFAAGFGVGLLLAYSLMRPEPTPQSRVTRMGRRTWDALSHALPESLTSRLHG